MERQVRERPQPETAVGKIAQGVKDAVLSVYWISFAVKGVMDAAKQESRAETETSAPARKAAKKKRRKFPGF